MNTLPHIEISQLIYIHYIANHVTDFSLVEALALNELSLNRLIPSF